VLDVKVGNGAFAPDLAFARAIASTLGDVAAGAGLKTSAWITDMNQVLGRTCGNAVEVLEAVRFLQGKERDPRLLAVIRALAGELLVLGHLEPNADAAEKAVDVVLADGRALEQFARMLSALGAQSDFIEHAAERLPRAPVQRALTAPASGWVSRIETRRIGIACIELGGGRHKAEDSVDPRVGLTRVAALGDRVEAGEPLAIVHAANESDAESVLRLLEDAFVIAESAPPPTPILVARVGGRTP
jgi:thymidine phosphorylase